MNLSSATKMYKRGKTKGQVVTTPNSRGCLNICWLTFRVNCLDTVYSKSAISVFDSINFSIKTTIVQQNVFRRKFSENRV